VTKFPTLPRWSYWLAAAVMLGLYGICSIAPREDSRPLGTVADIASLAKRDDLNVVFILVDTLRAQRLGSYGYERDTSPRLSKLAASGIRFANHSSQSSWTKSSMASLWTGLYPSRTHVLRYDDAVSEDARMPAEVLRDAGFHTYAIWRNGWVAPNFGFSQGFETYHNPQPVPIPASVRRENPSLEQGGSDSEVILSALEFLRTYGDERFLLYLHLMDVHQYIYDADSALFGTTYSDIYDNSIRRTDGHIGVVIDALEKLGLRDETIVVVASDHGEAFSEHGYEGHAKDLYSEVTRTPWIVSLPFRLEPGVVVDGPTENVDIWPTLFDLLGIAAPDGLDGRSRVPEIARVASTDGGATRLRFGELDRNWGQTRKKPHPLVAVSEGSFRLYYDAEHPDHPELYDLEEDPGEQVNIADREPERTARLSASAREQMEGRPSPWGGGAPKVEIDDMQLRQLRALGYKVD